ncbi:MAG: dienelactone hydrolase family protein [Alphaproteobacteria bacterium]|nr:dienelactone hydrolase family protein [Alphaproteobacteria bacterium]
MTSVVETPGVEIAPGYDGFAAISPQGGAVGLLILSEMFGVSPAMQDAAREFARAGIPTLVPNIFWRSRDNGVLGYEGQDRERAQSRADKLEAVAVCEDVELAIKALKRRVPELRRIAALGHCIGGTFAVTALGRTHLAAAISYYGFRISEMGDGFARLDKPAQLHYGLADPYIPVSEVEAVKALSRGNPHIAVFEYPEARHSFCNPYRPMYEEAHARTARERTLSLLRGLQS